MPYKLTYFPIRGLAEQIRLLLVDNQVPFEDVRVSGDDWPNVKSQFHFGQVPCLLEDNVQLVQSGAIMRHLARKFNLCGAGECETTFADMFYEGAKDLHVKYARLMYENYDTEKNKFTKEVMPTELGKLEKLLKTHKGGAGYVLGDKVSYADYEFFEVLDILQILDHNSLDNFPVLKAYHKGFLERPHIKKYYEQRLANKVPVNFNGKQ